MIAAPIAAEPKVTMKPNASSAAASQPSGLCSIRSRNGLLVATMPDKTDLLFEVRLGLSPAHSRTFGAWQRARYIGEPGKGEARGATTADQYEIRYRAEWPDEE